MHRAVKKTFENVDNEDNNVAVFKDVGLDYPI